jgi:hypothetical protein
MTDEQRIKPGRSKVLPQFLLARNEVHCCRV